MAVGFAPEGSWLASVLITIGAVAAYIAAWYFGPGSQGFRDGIRCLQRYPRIWRWLALLSLAYASFQTALALQLGELEWDLAAPLSVPVWKPMEWAGLWSRSWLRGLELLAGLFNQTVVSYPVSGVAALLFLLNFGGYHGQFIQAARRRLRRWWLPIYCGVVLCSIAALLKLVYAWLIYWLNQYADGIFLLRVGAVLDWLSFQFEYVFGLFIQIYLILVTLVWIRGLSADSERIFALVVRRSVYAAKWAGVFLVATSVLIHLPLLTSYLWISQHTDFTGAVIHYIDSFARPLLAIGTLAFASVQIILVLHNESLRKAIRDHFDLVRVHWLRLLWFLAFAGLHLFGIVILSEWVIGSLDESPLWRLGALLLFAALKAVVAGWLLSSWVCVYRRLQASKPEIRF
jgi:hypothetical protein